jgi:hypothetical protein
MLAARPPGDVLAAAHDAGVDLDGITPGSSPPSP